MPAFSVTARPDPMRKREDIEEKANARVAEELEGRAKAFYDPGTLGSGGTVRVAAEGNRLVVTPTSSQEMSEDAGVTGEGLDESRSPVTGAAFENLLDQEMRQILEYDYPRFLEDSIRDVISGDPRLTFDEEPL